MTDSRSEPVPKGLSTGGRKWWKRIVSAYALRPDELILLENACRTIDKIAELDAAMADQPLVTRGSMGQERENPLLSEARLQRTLLRQTLAQLKLPEEGGVQQGATNPHRTAAQSRWAAAHGSASQGWRYGQ